MKKNLLGTTTHVINHGPGSRKLILRNEVIRQLSRKTLELVAGGGSTDSDRPEGCSDPTQ
jgi:hypothetical protein